MTLCQGWWCSHFGQGRQMVWERTEGGHLCEQQSLNRGDALQHQKTLQQREKTPKQSIPMREHLASVRRKIWVLTTLNLSRTKIREGQASAARGWGWGEGNRTIDKLWKTAEINNNQWLDAVCVLTHKEWKKMSEEETHMISSRSTTPRTPSKGNNPH